MSRKSSRGTQIAWGQVKPKLANFDRNGLIALLQDLYAASKENRTFLHSRFGLGEDPLEPYKETIAHSLWPDWHKPVSVAAAKRAISSYGKANGNGQGMAELMTFFCEQAAGFARDVGLQDEGYLDALLRMYARALRSVAALEDPTRQEKMARLSHVRARCRDIGYGLFDEMTTLIEESGVGIEE